MKTLAVLAFVVVAPLSLLVASDKPKQDGKELVEQAEAKTNIFALPSFQMKAIVEVERNGKMLNGSYLLLWNGPAQWREEISFPGYNETQVGGKGVIFLKRTMDVIPLRIDQLHSALGYGSGMPHRGGAFVHVAPGPNETVKKIQDRKINGSKALCVEIENQKDRSREVCVDESTGSIARREPFVDRNITPVGSKVFPRFLSYVENGKTVAEVEVTEIKTTEPIPVSAFDPPVGTVSRVGCMNSVSGRLLKRVQPQYPEPERQAHVQGTVAIYGLIGTDGVPRQLQIVSGVSPGLNKASLDAIQQWQYEVAACDGTPVEVEAVISVNYSLSQF